MVFWDSSQTSLWADNFIQAWGLVDDQARFVGWMELDRVEPIDGKGIQGGER